MAKVAVSPVPEAAEAAVDGTLPSSTAAVFAPQTGSRPLCLSRSEELVLRSRMSESIRSTNRVADDRTPRVYTVARCQRGGPMEAARKGLAASRC
jgi:hypothetical protein